MNYYISGGMTNIPNFNFDLFDEVRDTLQAQGHGVFSPADHDRETITRLWPGKHPQDFPGYAVGDITQYFDEVSNGGEFTLGNMMVWDLDIIVNHVNAIVMLPGWESSTGAKYERMAAEAIGLPVLLATNSGTGWCLSSDIDQQRLTRLLKAAVHDETNGSRSARNEAQQKAGA